MPKHHHHHDHHWEDIPDEIVDATEEVQKFMGGDKKSKRLCRFAFDDGPYHRRASCGAIAGIATYLAKLAGAANANAEKNGHSLLPVDFHIPPHKRRNSVRRSAGFTIPTRLLSKVFGDEATPDIVEALVDGPPHDAAANIILMQLFEAIHDSICDGGKSTRRLSPNAFAPVNEKAND